MQKNISYLIAVFIITISASSCRKNCCVVPDNDYVVAKINNTETQFASSAPSIKGDTTYIYARSQKEQTVVLKLTQSTPGEYVFAGADYFTTLGLDVITSTYKLANTPANSFNIDFYLNNTNTRAQGRFNLVFVKNYPAPTQSAADTLKLTAGTFKLTFK